MCAAEIGEIGNGHVSPAMDRGVVVRVWRGTVKEFERHRFQIVERNDLIELTDQGRVSLYKERLDGGAVVVEDEFFTEVVGRAFYNPSALARAELFDPGFAVVIVEE